MSIANPRVFGRYEIVNRLGEGGMGEIFLARQVDVPGFDRLVTLKSVLPHLARDPAVIDAFLDEARVIGAINHQNVVGFYEVGEWEGTYFMAMEYVDGVDLDEVGSAARAADAPPTPRFVATVGRDAALGLDAAHHAADPNGNPLGIVHRDVTPHNIMLRRDGFVKLLDFGIAKAAGKRKKTETGVIQGKLGYFSPEQCGGDPLDGRSDMFALGIVLWELLTGERAFPGDNPLRVMHQIASQRLPPPSSRALLPPALDEVVARMTAPEPAERYASCGELAAALRGFLDSMAGDDTEVANTVERHCGSKLAARAQQRMQMVPVTLGGTSAPAPASVPAPAAPAPAPVAAGAPAAPAPAPQLSLPTQLTDADGNPVEGGPTFPPPPVPSMQGTTSAAGGFAGSSFREFELQVDDDAPPLELAHHKEGREVAGPAAGEMPEEAEEQYGLDDEDDDIDILTPAEEEVRDEVTVLWCRVEGLTEAGWGPEQRGRLMQQLEQSAGDAEASFAVVGGDGVVCILGTQQPRNELPGHGVRLATELVGAISEMAADFETIAGRVGVATGASPERDKNGVATPTVKDEAVDRARRLAAAANPGRVMVAQTTQLLTGRQVRYEQDLKTLSDQWNVPFAASEVAGFGPLPAAADLFGRERELAGIKFLIESAARRRAGGAVFCAEPGVGKSTLLLEGERIARWKGMVVSRAACGRNAFPVPYDAMRQLVKSAAMEVVERLGTDEDLVAASKSAPRAAAKLLNLRSSDSRRLRIFVGERRGERDAPRARRRTITRCAVFAFFRAIAEQVGVCFLCDDVDRIDEESLEMIQVVLTRLAGARAACLATSSAMPSSGVFSGLPPVQVPPLDRAAMNRVVVSATGGLPLPPEVLSVAFDRTAGHPLAALLLVRLWVRIQVLQREERRWVMTTDVRRVKTPGSVRELAWALAAKLSPVARAYLRTAAHYGTVVPQALLDPMFERGAAAIAALDEAASVGLVRVNKEDATISFLSPDVRDAVRMLPVERVGPAADASDVLTRGLMSHRVRDLPLGAEMLAMHARSVSSNEALARGCANTAAYHAACGHRALAAEQYHRALMAIFKLPRRDEHTVKRVLNLLSATIEWTAMHDPQQAADLAVPLLRDLPPEAAPSERATVQRTRADLLVGLGRLSDAQRAIDDALELCPADKNREQAALSLQVQARLYEAREDTAGAIAQLMAAIEIARSAELDNRDLVWSLWLDVGRLHASAHSAEQARQSLHHAFQEAARIKSIRGVATITDLTARSWYDSRDVKAAVACYDLAATQWLRWGDRAAASQSLHASALILARELHVEEAYQSAAQSLENAEEAEWPEGVAAAHKVLTVLEARR